MRARFTRFSFSTSFLHKYKLCVGRASEKDPKDSREKGHLPSAFGRLPERSLLLRRRRFSRGICPSSAGMVPSRMHAHVSLWYPRGESLSGCSSEWVNLRMAHQPPLRTSTGGFEAEGSQGSAFVTKVRGTLEFCAVARRSASSNGSLEDLVPGCGVKNIDWGNGRRNL